MLNKWSRLQRALKDNFSGWGEDLTDNVLVDGMSLRDRLLADKRRWLDDKLAFKMGAKYYAELRRKYQGAVDVESLLKGDSSLSRSDELHAALVAANSHPPQRKDWLNFMSTCSSLNQRELTAVLKMCLRLKPGSGAEQLQVLKSVMRCIIRLGLRTEHKTSIDLLQDKFHECLIQAHVAAVKTKTSTDAFIDTHLDLLEFVLPSVALKKVWELDASEPWTSVRTELKSLVASGELGVRLFGDALSELAAVEVDEVIEKHCTRLEGMSKVDSNAFSKLKRDAAADVLNIEGNALVSEKRVVHLKYRGLPLELQVHTRSDHIDVATQCSLKAMAAKSGDLLSLPAEDGLCGRPSPELSGLVSRDLLKDANAARDYVSKVMATVEDPDAASMKERPSN
eukprot:6390429-Amphidinium_carterae.2